MPLLTDKQVEEICHHDVNIISLWITKKASLLRSWDVPRRIRILSNAYIHYAKTASSAIVNSPSAPAFFAESRKVYLLNVLNQQIIALIPDLEESNNQVKCVIEDAKKNQISLSRALHLTNKVIAAKDKKTVILSAGIIILFIALLLFLVYRSFLSDPVFISFESLGLVVGALLTAYGHHQHRMVASMQKSVKDILSELENDAVIRQSLSRITDLSLDDQAVMVTKNRLENELDTQNGFVCTVCIDPVSTDKIINSLNQAVFTNIKNQPEETKQKNLQGPYHLGCLVEHERKRTSDSLRDPNTNRRELDLTPRQKQYIFYRLPLDKLHSKKVVDHPLEEEKKERRASI